MTIASSPARISGCLRRRCNWMGVSVQLATWRETIIDLNAEQIVTPGFYY
ncbi:hypothetical protein [Paramagnetospirillum kuznetsovii]|nr:hypothetical protein [Paramagnetospirillum kuznetsovii]